jgi:lipoprotein-anchoring transpeptidase ErfK/SrfK
VRLWPDNRRTLRRIAPLPRASRSTARVWLQVATLVVASALLLFFGSLVADAQAQTFIDVQPADWFYGSVEALAGQGVIRGGLDGTFKPYAPETRAEFASAMAALLHLPPTYNAPFTDVSPNDWFAGAVGALYGAGIAQGNAAGAFDPEAELSRQQAATLVIRAYACALGAAPETGAELLTDDDEVALWLQGFKDRAAIAPDHRAGVANAYHLGVVSGFDDARYYPFLSVTRGQAAGILYAALSQAPSARQELPENVTAEVEYPTARQGARGPLVAWMERKLAAISYQPGAVDGAFDARTAEAVMAFQKVEGLDRNGDATTAVWTRLISAERPTPLKDATGNRVEVDLTRQILFVIRDDAVGMTVPIASGRQGLRTPTGTFRAERKLPYWRQSALGLLYKPVYFHGGYAIHGSYSVPPYPASHGCVRVSVATMEVVYPLIPLGTRVDVYY